MSEANENREIAAAGAVDFPYRVCSISEKGPVRQQNEDSMVHFDSPFGHVVIVADGMGGHGHGDLAAALVVNGFQESLNRQDSEQISIADAIRTACSGVNAKIVEMAGDVNQAVMGSTVVMVVLHKSEFCVAHVGDSRAYLVRNNALSRLTKDHSVVQRDIDDGLLTEEQAREDSRSSMLTRALGTPNGENIEIHGPMPLMDGDGILLCTDGLHGFALDRQIEDAIVRNNLDPQKVTTGLVNLAIGTYFSNDNVTIQYIQIGKPKPPVRPVFGRPKRSSQSAEFAPQSTPEPRRSRFSKLLFWIVCLMILAGIAWVAYYSGTQVANGRKPNQDPVSASLSIADSICVYNPQQIKTDVKPTIELVLAQRAGPAANTNPMPVPIKCKDSAAQPNEVLGGDALARITLK